MPIIRQATLRRLRKRLAPDNIEGVIYIVRKSLVNEHNGSGKIEVLQRKGPIPSRVSFESYYRAKEELVAGRPQGEHRYLFELDAGTDIRATDKIEYIGQEWAPNLRVTEGLIYHPLTPNGYTYRAEQTGTTGPTPPMWNNVRGESFADGTVIWKNLGKYGVFEVIEISEVDSYEIVKDVFCDLRQ